MTFLAFKELLFSLKINGDRILRKNHEGITLCFGGNK